MEKKIEMHQSFTSRRILLTLQKCGKNTTKVDSVVESSLKDAFVLCRIFRKSGSGPKNGENYGAPFVDKEWEEDELVMVPKQDFAQGFPVVDDDAYLDADELEQILGSDTPDGHRPLLLEPHQGDNVSSDEVSTQMVHDPQNFSVGDFGAILYDFGMEGTLDKLMEDFIHHISKSKFY